MARNESLKLEIRESESLRILKLRIRESGFANPNLKDSFRGFVSWKFFFQITRFVSFRKDSYTNPASLVLGINYGTIPKVMLNILNVENVLLNNVSKNLSIHFNNCFESMMQNY